jgi:hypothetical protein
MENYSINITLDHEVHQFEIGEYLHHNGESCTVKVFQQGKMVASFAPDDRNFLHICQNPANIQEEILHLLADKLEATHPRTIPQDDEL